MWIRPFCVLCAICIHIRRESVQNVCGLSVAKNALAGYNEVVRKDKMRCIARSEQQQGGKKMNQHHAPMEGAAHTDKVKRLVGTAILAAIVVVLQLLGSYLKIGGLPISLVLVPIVIGAAVYGAGTGAFLGFVFSIVVAIAAITGADQFSVVLWTINPAMTLLVIFAKGILAGWVAGLLYRALCKKSVFGAVLSEMCIRDRRGADWCCAAAEHLIRPKLLRM